MTRSVDRPALPNYLCDLRPWSRVPVMTDWKKGLLAIALFLPVGVIAQAPTPSKALTLEQQGNFEQAAQVWQAVIARNPRDAGAFASLGVVLAKLQKYPEAASNYRKALALKPD